MEADTAAGPEAQQRRARVAEWEALAQEIQGLSAHGHKLQQRLIASASALEKSRAAEALARSQLQDALAASAAADRAKADAEQAVGAARGDLTVALLAPLAFSAFGLAAPLGRC